MPTCFMRQSKADMDKLLIMKTTEAQVRWWPIDDLVRNERPGGSFVEEQADDDLFTKPAAKPAAKPGAKIDAKPDVPVTPTPSINMQWLTKNARSYVSLEQIEYIVKLQRAWDENACLRVRRILDSRNR